MNDQEKLLQRWLYLWDLYQYVFRAFLILVVVSTSFRVSFVFRSADFNACDWKQLNLLKWFAS